MHTHIHKPTQTHTHAYTHPHTYTHPKQIHMHTQHTHPNRCNIYSHTQNRFTCIPTQNRFTCIHSHLNPKHTPLPHTINQIHITHIAHTKCIPLTHITHITITSHSPNVISSPTAMSRVASISSQDSVTVPVGYTNQAAHTTHTH